MSKAKTLEERSKRQKVWDLKRRPPSAKTLTTQNQHTQRLTVCGNITVHRCLG